MYGAVGQDAQQEMPTLRSRQIALPRGKSSEHFLYVTDKADIGKLRGKVGNRPADIAGNEPKHTSSRGCEIPDVQFRIEKNGGYLRAVEQILQIAVGVIEFGNFAVEFGVDGFQFFVGGLEFFLGAFQFFVGGLILLIRGLQFLIRGFQLFTRRLRTLLSRSEFTFEVPD